METKKYILNLSCKDQLGIVAAVTNSLSKIGLFVLELSQFSDCLTGQFFMRIFFENTQNAQKKVIEEKFSAVSKQFDMKWDLRDSGCKPKILLMVSKHSHCLNDLLHRWENGTLPVEIAGVVSNHHTLEEITSRCGLPFHLMPITKENKISQEKALLDLIRKENIELVVLARYMQILSEGICKEMHGKIINIHHSFLPSFKGAKPYHQAYDKGVKLIGATAHYVTSNLDEGPIIDQETIRVRHDHTPSELVRLGQDVECQVLARAVKWHVEQRVFLNRHKTVVFN